MLFKNYTRQELEKLCSMGIYPSMIGISDIGDTSKQYMEKGYDVDDAGVLMIYDKFGGDEHIINKKHN